jgi:DNA polymerase III subunit delta'
MAFRDIVGHRALLALLSRAVSRGTLPQSLVFAGPSGAGKRLTALAVAQALNCLTPIESAAGSTPDTPKNLQTVAEPAVGSPVSSGALPVDACGRCPACRRIAQLVHPDVVVVDAGPSIDDIRPLLTSATFRPFEARTRVFILDEADELSASVQNALLKTLEEPTRSSQFVLVTARPEMLLPTVRSRCTMLRFGPLPADLVRDLLVERFDVAPERAREAAFAGGGSIGDALVEATDASTAREIAEQIVAAIATARGPSSRLQVAAALLQPSDSPGRVARRGQTKRARPVSKIASDRELVGERLQALGSVLRDLSVAAAAAPDRWMSRTPSGELAAVTRAFGIERLVNAFRAVDRAREALARNVSPKTVVDWVALQI